MKVEEFKMTKIRVNEVKRVIEVSKAFAKEASKFGTMEYRELQEVRRDYPNFKVITKSAAKNKDGFKGLTFDYMEKYIKEHREIEIKNEETGEVEKKDLLVEFYGYCGKDENGKKLEIAKSAAYAEVKKWFLEQYPVFKEHRNNVKNISKKIA